MSAAQAMLLGGGINIVVSIEDTEANAAFQDARYELRSDGTIEVNNVVWGNWLVTGLSSQVEAYAEKIGGTLTGGLLNSWGPLSFNTAWTAQNATIRVKLRAAANPSVILDEAVIYLIADNTL